MTEATIVAGGPGDFMTVRHLVARGNQVDIGYALAEQARAVSGWHPRPAEANIGAARRDWFRRNWPQQHARLRGVAAAFGIDPDRTDVHLDGLASVPAGSGCSAVWCPPGSATDGRGRMARNYDFFTASEAELFAQLAGQSVPPGTGVPMASRPYVITSVPGDGMASTVLTMSELDGCMEGVNEAGLCVALLIADIEHTEPPALDIGPRAGLNQPQVLRFLLDTCENTDQAKRALLGAKQYDYGMACHYLVADTSGNGFVYERGAADAEYFIELGNAPLCVTNHLLHKHSDLDALPADTEETMRTFERARTLGKRTAHSRQSDVDLRCALEEVAMQVRPDAPWRTLWRSLFAPAQRSMTTTFYLGDETGGTARYSAELTFPVHR